MTHAERVVALLSDEIRRLEIELAITKAELEMLKETKPPEELPKADEHTSDAQEASFLLEEKQ